MVASLMYHSQLLQHINPSLLHQHSLVRAENVKADDFLTSRSPVKENIRCYQHSAAKNTTNPHIKILLKMFLQFFLYKSSPSCQQHV